MSTGCGFLSEVPLRAAENRVPTRDTHAMIAGMSDSAEQSAPEPLSDDERRKRRRERRLSASRSAQRILARLGFQLTLRERLALLDTASELYDLDERVDMYGDGVVEAVEEKVAGLLGTEAAAFFPTGTMAQQVALRC